MKVNELEGVALDWAVAKCEGEEFFISDGSVFIPDWEGVDDPYLYRPSILWADSGPIIEREWLDITPWPNESREDMRWHCQQHDSAGDCAQYGPTPLIAAMRCYVASQMGDEIEVPEELLQGEKA